MAQFETKKFDTSKQKKKKKNALKRQKKSYF